MIVNKRSVARMLGKFSAIFDAINETGYTCTYLDIQDFQNDYS